MADNLDSILHQLEEIIAERKNADMHESYSAQLIKGPIDKLLKKIGEEAVEVVIAGKGGNQSEIIYESADLIYHLMVLFARENIKLDALAVELSKRFKMSGLAEKASRKP